MTRINSKNPSCNVSAVGFDFRLESRKRKKYWREFDLFWNQWKQIPFISEDEEDPPHVWELPTIKLSSLDYGYIREIEELITKYFQIPMGKMVNVQWQTEGNSIIGFACHSHFDRTFHTDPANPISDIEFWFDLGEKLSHISTIRHISFYHHYTTLITSST